MSSLRHNPLPCGEKTVNRGENKRPAEVKLPVFICKCSKYYGCIVV